MSSVYQTTVIQGDPQGEFQFSQPFDSLSHAVSFALDNSKVGDWIEVAEVIQDATGEYEQIETILNFERERDL